MLTCAFDRIFNQPPAFTFVEGHRTPVRNRLRQSPVAVVLSRDGLDFGSALPAQYARPRFVANYEGHLLVDVVLLDAIDLDGGMISGRTKQMPRFQISRVNVGPGIDDERSSASRDFDRESIVVTVRAATVDSGAARVKEQIQIVVAKHVSSGIGKGLRLRRLSIRQRHIVSHALLSQDPK